MVFVSPIKLSLLVPVHDPEGVYGSFLADLVSSVLVQSRLPDEVLFVSNHPIAYQQKLVDQAGTDLQLRFERTTAQNAPENINAGVQLVQGRITKILFQDDYLRGLDSLETTMAELEKSGRFWITTGCNHLSEGRGEHSPHSPRISRKLLQGANYIGAPSVVAFRTEAYQRMDTTLRYVFDCDWYLRMWHAHGRPAVIRGTMVTIRLHAGQATHWAKELLGEEVERMKSSHERVGSLGRLCACVSGGPRLDYLSTQNESA